MNLLITKNILKTIFFIFLSTLISTDLNAQYFGDQNVLTSCAVCGVDIMKSADLDGDNDNDIVTYSGNDEKVVWLENDGNGNFNTHSVLIYDISFVSDIELADLDNDGDIDILVSSSWDDLVIWFENDGTGKFSSEKIISEEETYDMAIIDMDGDNYLDIIIAVSGWDDKMVWHKNQANGTFASEEVISVNDGGFKSIEAADINEDGLIDIIGAANNNNRVAWFQNDGNGGFTQNILTSDAEDASDVDVADLNGDGHLDIIFTSRFDGKRGWFQNLENGNFGTENIIADLHFSSIIFSEDVENDGDMDVVFIEYGNIVWYENDGTGTFDTSYTLAADFNEFPKVLMADLDMDGINDLVYGDKNVDKIFWKKNLNDGIFDEPIIITEQEAEGLRKVISFDMDNDDDEDLFSITNWSDEIAYFENLGNGEFGPYTVIFENIDRAEDFISADLNNDGKTDIIYHSDEDDKLGWLKNLGDGNFEDQTPISNLAKDTRDLFAVDIDNDGDTDIISSADLWSDPDVIALYENLGNGSFADQIIISSEVNRPRTITAADLDEDGDMDILTASFSDDNIVWFENLGNNSFADLVILSSEIEEPISLVIADINNDNHLDVLAANSTSYPGKVIWFENDGNAILGSPNLISSNVSDPLSVVAADIDSDGNLDVLSASLNDDKISWYRNEGNGIFGDENIITTLASNARIVGTADLDNDGDLDVFSGSSNDSKVAWYENTQSVATYEIENTGVKISPNPTNSILNIELESPFDFQINLFDIYGKLIVRKNNKNQLDVSALPHGTYFLRINDLESGHQIVKKIIVTE